LSSDARKLEAHSKPESADGRSVELAAAGLLDDGIGDARVGHQPEPVDLSDAGAAEAGGLRAVLIPLPPGRSAARTAGLQRTIRARQRVGLILQDLE